MVKIKLGCDVSKDKLDFYCLDTDEHFVLRNNDAGLRKLLLWAKQNQFDLDQISLAFENTGAYSSLLAKFCEQHGITFYQIPPLQLKRSLGLTRGKNDKIDSKRIAEYLKEKAYKLSPSKAPSPFNEELARLKNQRALLVRQRTAQKNNLRLFEEVRKLPDTDLSLSVARRMIETLDTYIEEIEEKILEIIQQDEALNRNYNILTSMVGVGPVSATMLLVETGNFTRFSNWRSVACYCGSAPFANSSGKQQGKPSISHFAQKEMKHILTRAARSAARHDPDLKKYKDRKSLEGKSERLIINNIRCKILATAFALIRDQRGYEKNYSQNLAA